MGKIDNVSRLCKAQIGKIRRRIWRCDGKDPSVRRGHLRAIRHPYPHGLLAELKNPPLCLRENEGDESRRSTFRLAQIDESRSAGYAALRHRQEVLKRLTPAPVSRLVGPGTAHRPYLPAVENVLNMYRHQKPPRPKRIRSIFDSGTGDICTGFCSPASKVMACSNAMLYNCTRDFTSIPPCATAGAISMARA